MTQVQFEQYYNLLEELHLLIMEGDLDQWAKVKADFDLKFPQTEVIQILDKVEPEPKTEENVNWLQMLIEASESEGYNVDYLKN